MEYEKSKTNYIVVFDMDETLGHFEQINIFYRVLKKHFQNKLKLSDFYDLFDLFNKFLRPKIMQILEYLKDKKEKGFCNKIMIYTNNPSKSWSNLISSYFNYKLQSPLFDQTIIAFKSNGRILEVNRTRQDKSFDDLINCTKLPEDTQICFVDDVYHPAMEHKNVVYIHIKPYVYSMPFEKMISIFYHKNKTKIPNKKDFVDFMILHLNNYDYNIKIKSPLEQRVDEVLTKKIFEHLDEFFEGKKLRNFTL